ncbi:MAG: glycosyltransferase [Candidatus Sulfotelmatobacter sp.]
MRRQMEAPVLEPLTGEEISLESSTVNSVPPGLFLMIDSLQTGGSERQFVALSRSIDPKSFRLHLGCIQAKGAFLDELNNVQQFPLGGSLYGLQAGRTLLRLRSHLRRHTIDIAHAFDFYANLVLVPAAKLARVPVIIGSQRQLGDLLTPAQSRAQMTMFRWCDAVVCNSRAAANRLVDRGLAECKITVIWNGLPDQAFAETAPALPKIPGLLRVGMIARMNTRAKNHSILLRVAARLQSEFPQTEFVIAGDGPLRRDLEAEAAHLGLGDRVRFLGDRRDISAILRSLDLSVLPSASESLSNAILESMAAGVPVVASDVGGNVELVSEERGILFPMGDELGLSASLARLLRDGDLRRQMGRICRQFTRENFTLERMRKGHEELYARLLACKRRRAHRRLEKLQDGS